MTKKYEATAGQINISVTEHCLQEEEVEVFIDAVTGKNQPELAIYLPFCPEQVAKKLEKKSLKIQFLYRPKCVLRRLFGI